MAKLFELKQERATLTNSIRSLMNEFENSPMPAEKKGELEKMEARFDEIGRIVDLESRQIERERAIGEVVDKNAPESRKSEIMDAFVNHIRGGGTNTLDIYNAMSQDSPTQAGYVVAPVQWTGELLKSLDDLVFIRQKASVSQLDKALSLGYITRTARMSAAVWGTEIAAPTADAQLAFGKREFKANAATAEILVSKTLMRNAPNADGIVRDELAYIFGALQETAFMTGDGNNKPLGLFTASADGIPTSRDVSTGNTATEIKIDGLIETKYSVKQQYQPGAEWIFNRLAVKQLAKLKDSDGQYVWQPSVAMGAPDILLGKPVNMTEYAPSTFTTGLYVGLYGNLKYYKIVDSLSLEIQALMELQARTNQIDYIARLETDGQPYDAEAFARVKLA